MVYAIYNILGHIPDRCQPRTLTFHAFRHGGICRAWLDKYDFQRLPGKSVT